MLHAMLTLYGVCELGWRGKAECTIPIWLATPASFGKWADTHQKMEL